MKFQCLMIKILMNKMTKIINKCKTIKKNLYIFFNNINFSNSQSNYKIQITLK